MSEQFIANRNLYHTFSRIAIQEGQSIAAAVNKTGHTVTTNDIWTDVDKLPKNTTYFGKANAAFDDLKIVFDSNPEYAKYVTLCEGTLTPVDGSGQDAGKNQAWQLLIDGKRVTNFIAPTDVLDNDGKPCNGYTLQLFDKTDTQIDAAAGNWMFDYLAGLVIFERGKTPQDMGWAGTEYSKYIKIKAWRYTGGFLNTKLEDLDDIIASSDNFGSHSIEIRKQSSAVEGYASSYQLYVDDVAKGATINIPKDQFLKDAVIVEGIYTEGVFTASEDITDEQLKKDIKKYIHFTFEIKVKDPVTLAETTQEKHIYLDIQDLCDVYTGGYGITVTADNVINVKLGTDDETAKYLGFDNTSALVIDNLDVDKDVTYNYITAANTVSGNLVALDTAIKDAEHTHTAGNKGITISETPGQVFIGAVVASNDLHLGISTNGIETSGLVTASGYVISADTTVAANLEALDTEIGDLVSGAYISGDVIASDLKALDTQVKTNADAIANLIKDCVIKITSGSVTMTDEYAAFSDLLGTTTAPSDGVVTIVFNREVLEIGQRDNIETISGLSGKFEDVYPDEEFDAKNTVTTLSADFGSYLAGKNNEDEVKTVQWRITYRG